MASSELSALFSVPEHSTQVATLSRLLSTYPQQVPSAQDLFYKYEAQLISHAVPRGGEEAPRGLDREALEMLEAGLREEQRKSEREALMTPMRGAARSNGFATTPRTPMGAPFARGSGSNPASASSLRSSAASPATPATPAPHRAPLTSLEVLNAHIDKAPPGAERPGPQRVALAVGTDPRAWGYRYMFERAGGKGEALDDRIDALSAALLEAYSLPAGDIADPSLPTQDPVYVLGRLCPALPRAVPGADEADDLASDGRGYPALSRENIVIESSRLVGAGSRTPLVFPERTAVRTPEARVAFDRAGLFPGMVVGLLGKNGGAGKFVVDELLLPPALPHASTDVADLLTHQHDAARLASGPMSLLVASGPYSAESDLAFGPWHRLLDAVEEERPDVVLLLGPFLSLSHPALLAPGQDLLPEEVFKAHISERLARLEKTAPRTTVILVPSTKDAASKHAAWPQPMLDKKDASLGIPKRVKCLPNPSMFSINEIVIGVSTGDVLRDLGKEETCIDVRKPYGAADAAAAPASASTGAAAAKEDPLARACRHVLSQRSFYPLFPASLATGHPLDVTHSALAHFSSITPDLLILPSLLRPFARIVDSTVFVNPGAAARAAASDNAGAGSFARVDVRAMRRERLEGEREERIAHEAWERARVELLRI